MRKFLSLLHRTQDKHISQDSFRLLPRNRALPLLQPTTTVFCAPAVLPFPGCCANETVQLENLDKFFYLTKCI